MKKSLIGLVLLLSLGFSTVALAQIGGSPPPGGGNSGGSPVGGGPGSGTTSTAGTGNSATIDIPNPLRCNNVDCVVSGIFSVIWYLSWPVVTLMILWGAFQILTSGGSSEKVEQARRTIMYAIIGFVVIMFARSIVYLVRNVLSAGADQSSTSAPPPGSTTP